MIAKNPEEIDNIRKACAITRDALKFAGTLIKPGITTLELDEKVTEFIIKRGGGLSCKGFEGYPATICTSINEEVNHSIPSKRKLIEGDIISVDLAVSFNGYHGDAARTFPVGKITAEKQKLITVCEECFFEAVKDLKAGCRVGEISSKIQQHAEVNGYSVVRELVGHGIGKNMHESPDVPNYGKSAEGPVIKENVCLAIEPMINIGKKDVYMLNDGWTIITRDRKPSAHYENTVLVLKDGCEILTI